MCLQNNIPDRPLKKWPLFIFYLFLNGDRGRFTMHISIAKKRIKCNKLKETCDKQESKRGQATQQLEERNSPRPLSDRPRPLSEIAPVR